MLTPSQEGHSGIGLLLHNIKPIPLCLFKEIVCFLYSFKTKKDPNGIPRSLKFPGGDGGIRTHDLLNANQALSQLSYAPISYYYITTFPI